MTAPGPHAMRIGLLASFQGSAHSADGAGKGWHTLELERAAGALGVDLVPVEFRTLAAGVETAGDGVRAGRLHLAELDAVLVRSVPPGTLEQVVFRMDALHRLSERGVTVVNSPRAIECAVDKYLALARIAACGAPVPRTRVAQTAAAAAADFEALGGDVLVKPLFGSEGRGILRVSSAPLAERAFATLERLGAIIYQQEFLASDGWDVRALVVGGAVVAAMRRVLPPGPNGELGWLGNVSRGARPEPYEAPREVVELALAAAAAVGADIAGVDLLPAPDGWRVLEVNSSPGWSGLASVTDLDIARAVLERVVTLALRT